MALKARFGENRMFFIRLDMKENPNNQPTAEKCTPSAFGISPGGGDVLRTYHSYLKPLSSIDRISQNRYLQMESLCYCISEKVEQFIS